MRRREIQETKELIIQWLEEEKKWQERKPAEPNIIKAELLFTRKCPLDCDFCAMKRDYGEELGLDKWEEGLVQLKQLQCGFVAIYGAEPTQDLEKLKGIIKLCNKYEIACTVITNGVLLNDKKMQDLYDSGLRSVTVSIDSLKAMDKRALAGMKVIDFFSSKQMRDIEVCITIHRDNLEELPEMIEYFSKRGVWVHFDILHFGINEGTKCSDSEEVRELDFKVRSDLRWIRSVMHKVELQKKSGRLIHPSEDLIKRWGAPLNLNRGWKCSKASWVTVDADGSVYLCDDFQPEELRGKYMVWEIYDRWPEFKEEALRLVKERCRGCFWGTHVMSEEMVDNDKGTDYFAHKIRRID